MCVCVCVSAHPSYEYHMIHWFTKAKCALRIKKKYGWAHPYLEIYKTRKTRKKPHLTSWYLTMQLPSSHSNTSTSILWIFLDFPSPFGRLIGSASVLVAHSFFLAETASFHSIHNPGAIIDSLRHLCLDQEIFLMIIVAAILLTLYVIQTVGMNAVLVTFILFLFFIRISFHLKHKSWK